jgi:hypothetical protein
MEGDPVMTLYDYKLWKLLAILAAVVLCLWVVCGCAPIESGVARGGGTTANPGANFTVDLASGKASFATNRDDKCTIGPIEGQPGKGINITIPKDVKSPLAGATFETGPIDIDANASKVRKSNVPQIQAMDEFNRGALEGWSGLVDSMGNAIVSPVMGRLYPNTGSDIAKSFSMLFMIVLVVVIAVVGTAVAIILAVMFAKFFAWAFPKKDNTQLLLQAMMASQVNRAVPAS